MSVRPPRRIATGGGKDSRDDGNSRGRKKAAVIDEQGFRKVFESFVSTLVEPCGLSSVLEQLAANIVEVIEVAGAGVMIEDKQGDLRFTSTSDEKLSRLESLQIELDEGPCLMAFRTGEVVIAGDLRTDARFPRFGPRALEAGMAAVYSFPLRRGDSTIGALNLYRPYPGDFDAEQIDVGRSFAQIATVFLVHAEEVQEAKLLNMQLQQALNTRVLIEQAKGFVAGSSGLSTDDAFTVLRRHARNRGAKLSDVARSVITRQLPVEELLGGT